MKNGYGITLLIACVALATSFGMSTESMADSDEDSAQQRTYAYANGAEGKAEAMHDDDDDEDEGKAKKDKNSKHSSWYGQQASVLPVSNALYTQECAACHFAYLPGLLPAASWKHLMATLDDHYGDDASLDDAQTVNEISAFLQRFAADQSKARRSMQIMASLKNKPAPASISDIPYIQHKHRGIPEKMITKNKSVRSLSNCIACHDKADRGVFTEHGLKIPGYGYWED